MEGAGSPAEINLKQEDIVNMGMARMAGAPVLLAGDIDRGGVFASLYGTIALLEPGEQRLVKGTVINKFRGDVDILRPGLQMLEQLTHVPVLGVVPCLDVHIEEEDSLAGGLAAGAAPSLIDVAVIRLPRISNFTDFSALEQVEGVGLRYVRQARELGAPDLVILPGTKNTMGDLQWLRESGLEAAVQKLAAQGTPVIGICGGYQMLGHTLQDPDGVEQGGRMRGMGLLPVDTVFEPQKVRTRVQGQVLAGSGFFALLEGARFEGYEIHMGRRPSPRGNCRPWPGWNRAGRPRQTAPARAMCWGAMSTACSTAATCAAGWQPCCLPAGAWTPAKSRQWITPSIKKNSTTNWPRPCGKAWTWNRSTGSWKPERRDKHEDPVGKREACRHRKAELCHHHPGAGGAAAAGGKRKRDQAGHPHHSGF